MALAKSLYSDSNSPQVARNVITIDWNTLAYVRFQIPKPPQTWKDARVTTLSWDATVASVTATCVNYFNIGGNNAQLWRSFDQVALQYADIYTSPSFRPITPQPGLNADNVAVSFILPSGVAKLKLILPDKNGPEWTFTNADAFTGIFGISGVLTADDYAYTTVGNIKEAVNTWRSNRNVNKYMRLSLQQADGTYIYLQYPLLY